MMFRVSDYFVGNKELSQNMDHYSFHHLNGIKIYKISQLVAEWDIRKYAAKWMMKIFLGKVDWYGNR